MNLGGPAHHVSLLSSRLDPRKYDSLLLTGEVAAGEEEHTIDGLVCKRLSGFGPDIRPDRDLVALAQMTRLMRAWRPQIVDTHTAKAGMLGRIAARSVRPRPIVVHTFHGHVLRGYFGAPKSEAFTRIERTLARGSDRLVAVSDATADELVEIGVAPREKFTVIPLGLELDPFLSLDPRPDPEARRRLGIGEEEVAFAFIGRLAPIKRADLMLRALAAARDAGAPARVLVIGDGLERPELEALAARLGCRGSVDFLGYRRDVASLLAAADAALLTSDNEGTPVALIEAAAAARPAVATAVGGVADIVVPGAGLLAPAGDAAALAARIAELAADAELRRRMGERARQHVAGRYAVERMLADVDALYTELLAERGRRR